jgi:hypothetical protein
MTAGMLRFGLHLDATSLRSLGVPLQFVWRHNPASIADIALCSMRISDLRDHPFSDKTFWR